MALVSLGVPVLATTGQDEGDQDVVDGSLSDNGGIKGTVQNISQPVDILSHSAQEEGGYLHVVGDIYHVRNSSSQ
jgi:hypothetical protein